jgi:hypothetical protein
MLKFESIICYLNFLGIKTKIRKKVHIYVGYIFNFLSSIWTFFLLSCWVILSLSTNWLWSVSVTSNTLWCRQCDVKHIMMSSVWRQTHYDVISVTSNTLWCHQCDVKHIMMSLIKTVMSVLTVSTYIITSMTACPIILPVIPAIMSGPSQLSLFYL